MVASGETGTSSSSGCMDDLEDLLGAVLAREALRGGEETAPEEKEEVEEEEEEEEEEEKREEKKRTRRGRDDDDDDDDELSSRPRTRARGADEEEEKKRIPLNVTDLPGDCLEKIVTRLSPADLLALSCACTTFRHLCSSQPLWRCLYYDRWPSGRRVLDGIKLASHEDDGVDIASWKDLYVREDAGELEELVGSVGSVGSVGGGSALFVEMAKGWREVPVRDWDSEAVRVVHQSSMVLPGTKHVGHGLGGQQASFRGSSERLARYMAEHNMTGMSGMTGMTGMSGMGGTSGSGAKTAQHECAFDKIGHTAYVCRVCGRLHRCDGGCAYVRRMGSGNDGDGLAEVCTLTGVMREMAFVGEGGDGG
ncbi:MAG: F-box protein, partial [bacterium]